MGDDDGTLSIYSDYVCPFCYLGRESLAQYEADRGAPVAIDWQPFDLRGHQRDADGQLDPDRPSVKDEAYFERARANVRRLQERYGAEMKQELATDVDSLAAQLVSLAVTERAPARWRAFDEAVFEALWVDGRDIADPAVLASIATDVGIDAAVVHEALADDALRDRLDDRFEAARRDGVTAVPTFVYEGHIARGAVPPEQLRRLVEGVEESS